MMVDVELRRMAPSLLDWEVYYEERLLGQLTSDCMDRMGKWFYRTENDRCRDKGWNLNHFCIGQEEAALQLVRIHLAEKGAYWE